MPNNEEQTKECSKCGQEKPLSGFHKGKRYRLGVKSQCKVCVSERGKQYHQENKDKKSEQNKQYYQKKRDKKKQYRQENRDKILERQRQYCQNLPSMIYEIHNTTTKQIYVGQTSQGRQRWNSHKSKLRNGIHKNPQLQKDWDKWGKDAFRFNIVEELPCDLNTEQLLEKEATLMLEHISNGAKLYNEDIPK
jgi:hypothetical protein